MSDLRQRAYARAIRWISRAYPRSFRDRFEDGMAFTLGAQASEARRRGRWAALCFWVRAAASAAILGSLERLRELPALGDVLGTTLQDLRVAARRLARAPGFTLTAIVTLALGLGATTTIHAVVDSVLIEPLPYPESDRLVWIGHTAEGAGIPRMGSSYGAFLHYRDLAESLEAVAIYAPRGATLVDDEGPQRVETALVSHQLFDLLFEGRPAAGRWIEAADDVFGAPRIAVISHELWQSRYGGSPTALGSVESLDGEPVEIVGVMPPSFRFGQRNPAFLLPVQLNEPEVLLGAFGRTMIGRMRPGLHADDVQRDLVSLLPSMQDRFNRVAYDLLVRDGRLSPIVEPLKTAWVGSVANALWMLFGAVAIVLAIACANVANLFLVRAEGRRREGWIRTALGAGRWPVVRMFLAESLLLAAAGGIAGLGLASIGVRLLVRHGPQSLPRLETVGLEPATVGGTMVVAAAAALVFGLLAGLRRAPDDLSGGIQDGGRGSTGGARTSRLRRVLVVAQVSLALVLLVAAGLMLQSFVRLGGVDPGFEPDGALTFRVALSPLEYPDNLAAARLQQTLAERLATLPGVTAAGAIGCLPLANCGSMNVAYPADRAVVEGEVPDAVQVIPASGGVFEALGIPLREGRVFAARDVGGPPVAIVSENLARRLWPDGSALGQGIHPDFPDEEPYTIVGVVGDHYSAGLADGPTENLYLSLAGSYEYMANPRNLSFVLRSERDPTGLAAPARAVLAELDPTAPMIDTRPLADLAEAGRASTSFTLVLLSIAGSIALVLGMVGVYGVLAYMVGQRTGEIGVRMALGARAGDVRQLVAREGLALVSLGVALGIIGALLLSRTLASVLFGVTATDPATYVAVTILLGATAMLASLLPARRAARIDPVEALRSDSA